MISPFAVSKKIKMKKSTPTAGTAENGVYYRRFNTMRLHSGNDLIQYLGQLVSSLELTLGLGLLAPETSFFRCCFGADSLGIKGNSPPSSGQQCCKDNL